MKSWCVHMYGFSESIASCLAVNWNTFKCFWIQINIKYHFAIFLFPNTTYIVFHASIWKCYKRHIPRLTDRLSSVDVHEYENNITIKSLLFQASSTYIMHVIFKTCDFGSDSEFKWIVINKIILPISGSNRAAKTTVFFRCLLRRVNFETWILFGNFVIKKIICIIAYISTF